MIEIKIKAQTSELITHLKRNKSEHVEEFEQARKVYFTEVGEKLREMLSDADGNVFRDDAFSIKLRPPVNEENKYDKYINMLEMSEEDIIEIGVDEYERFVEDKWDWAVFAKNLNSSYSGKF